MSEALARTGLKPTLDFSPTGCYNVSAIGTLAKGHATMKYAIKFKSHDKNGEFSIYLAKFERGRFGLWKGVSAVHCSTRPSKARKFKSAAGAKRVLDEIRNTQCGSLWSIEGEGEVVEVGV